MTYTHYYVQSRQLEQSCYRAQGAQPVLCSGIECERKGGSRGRIHVKHTADSVVGHREIPHIKQLCSIKKILNALSKI